MLHKINFILILLSIFASVILADVAVNPTMPRQCYSCEGINCQRTTMLNVTVNCSDLLDICVTAFDGFTVAARGCYLDMPEMYRNKCNDRNNPECFKCFGQLCNNKGREDFKCVECNSKDDMKCKTDTTNMTPKLCNIPTAQNTYCYIRDAGDNIQRGCFVHVQEQLDCMNDIKCSMCLSGDGIACNSYDIKTTSAAYRNGILSLNIFALLIAIYVR